MKKTMSFKRIGAVAAAAVMATTLFMQTAFAQEAVDKVIKIISLGHIEVSQEEPSDFKEMPVPDVLKGKLFTKDGKEVTVFTKDMDSVYTKDGERIENMDFKTGKITTEAEGKAERENIMLIEKDQSKLNDYLCFKAQLPAYLPEGYCFDHAELYKDEDGTVKNSKYIDLYFTNQTTGKTLFLQERFADEETGYCTGTEGKLEEVQINGVKAALSDESELNWEKDGVLFGYMTKNNISKEELIKSAESIK